MLRLFAFLLPVLFGAACAQVSIPLLSQDERLIELSPSAQIFGEMEYDVVALIEQGREVEGHRDLMTEYGGYRYSFARLDSLKKFEAEPQRYAVQLDGGCGRMGALSGRGDTDRYAVHEGKLYIFASDGCREGFLADPTAVLEPQLDPWVAAGANEELLGQERLNGLLEWMGGPKAVDGTQLNWSLDTEVEYQGVLVRSGNYEVIGPGARYRTAYRWKSDVHSKEVADGEAWAHDPRMGKWRMGKAQLRALERRSQAHLLTLLQDRDHEDTLLWAEASDTPGVDILHLASHGFAHRIGIERETGRPLWHEYGGIGSDITFGQIRDSYSSWETVRGLRVPIAWERSFNGEPVTTVDRAAEGWKLRVRHCDQVRATRYLVSPQAPDHGPFGGRRSG